VTIPEETREDADREHADLTANDVVDSSSRPNELEHQEAADSGPDDGMEARASAVDNGEEAEALLPSDNAQRFRERWETVQAGFVDKPRETVEEADDLVRDLVQELTAGFVQRRENLEQHWNEGDEASTEDLRVALTHYRAFFNRLLST
jgi:hypothetical protein